MYGYCFSKSIREVFVGALTIHNCFRKLGGEFKCGYVYLHCLENLGPSLLAHHSYKSCDPYLINMI